MDLGSLISIVHGQGVWAILFMIALWFAAKAIKKYITKLQSQNDKREKQIFDLYANQKRESLRREETLMKHLEKTTESLDQITVTVKQMQTEMSMGFNEIWNHLKRDVN